MRLATWRGWDPEDLLAEAGILLGQVRGHLHVQGLVQLGQDDLAQVEEAWRAGGRRRGPGTVSRTRFPAGRYRSPFPFPRPGRTGVGQPGLDELVQQLLGDGAARAPPRLAAAPGLHRAQRSWPQSLPSGSHHRLSPESQATCLSFRLSFFRASATQRCEAPTLAAMWMHHENTMLSERSQTQKDTQGVTPLRGNVQNR